MDFPDSNNADSSSTSHRDSRVSNLSRTSREHQQRPQSVLEEHRLQLDAAFTQIGALNFELTQAIKEKSRVTDEVARLTQANLKLKTQLQELLHSKSKQGVHIEACSKHLSTLLTENKTLLASQQSAKIYAYEPPSLMSELNATRSQLQTLREQYTDTLNSLREQTTSAQRWEQQCHFAKTEAEQLKCQRLQLTNTEKEVEQLKAKARDAEYGLLKAQRDLATVQEEAEHYKAIISDLKQKRQVSADEHSSPVVVKYLDNTDLVKELERARSNEMEANRQVRQVQSQLETLQARQTTTEKETELALAYKKDLETRLEVLTIEVHDRRSTEQTLQRTVQTLQTQLSTARADCEVALKQLHSERLRATDVSTELCRNQQSLAKQCHQLNTLEAENKSLKAELSDTRSERMHMTTQLELAARKLEESQALSFSYNLDRLTYKHQNSLSDSDPLKKANRKLEEQATSLERQVQISQQEINELKQFLKQAHTEIQRIEAEKYTLLGEKSQTSHANLSQSAVIEQLNQQVANLQVQLEAASLNTQEAVANSTAFKQSLDYVNEDNATLRCRVQTLIAEKEELQAQLEEAHQQRTASSASHLSMDKLQIQLAHAEQRLSYAEHSLETAIEERQSLQVSVSSLRSRLEAAQSHSSVVEKSLAKSQAEVRLLTEEVNELREHANTRAFEAIQAKYSSEKEEWEKQNMNANNTIEELKRLVEETNTKSQRRFEELKQQKDTEIQKLETVLREQRSDFLRMELEYERVKEAFEGR